LFQFQHTEYLFALSAIPVLITLYLFVQQWKKKAIKKMGDELLVKQLIKGYSPANFLLKFILITAAYTIAVVALANPRMPSGTAGTNRSGIDVMIALDVSRSMLARDIKPDRLDRAKQFIAKLMDKLSDDRIGIVVFAGKAYLQMPLTTDHAAAKMYLSSATPDVVPTQGTVIGDALKMCYNAFSSKEKKYRAVVLISDGEDHDENAIKIAKAMADEGVMVNTVGIGSPEGAMIVDAATNEVKRDLEGHPVLTRLNETTLQNIAMNGNGLYQLFTSADAVATSIEAQLQKMGQRTFTDSSMLMYRSFFQWFAAAAMLLLLIEFFISEKKKIANATPSIVTKKAAVAGLMLLIGKPVFSQTNDKIIRQGNEAYARKQYETAAANYKKAAAKNPADEKAVFNLGNALYKNGKIEEAVQAYDAAIIKDRLPANKGTSFYNKGVVLQNEKKLPDCIEAYKNSLRLNPADEDARLNLQKALLEQKKQQQQKDSNKQQKSNNKKEQQPKPQPSKMTKKEAEEKLKALMQQEKNLQDKLRKVDATSPQKPEKDW
jgi:tetratricopeptide (TPR) repeat protein